VETVLHRLVRGTGLAGLAGMPRVRPLSPTVTLVRPILGARREEVLQYLAAIGQDFRHDSTNSDCRFTRNRIRRELLPSLREQYNTNVDEALANLAQQADEAQRVISELVQELVEQCVRVRPQPQNGSLSQASPVESLSAAEVRIDCGPLRGKPKVIVCEVCRAAWSSAGWPLQSMGFVRWQQLADLIECPDAQPLNLPGNFQARRRDDVVEIRLLASPKARS
jgi:tRNA(Ile)-lysidine synthase